MLSGGNLLYRDDCIKWKHLGREYLHLSHISKSQLWWIHLWPSTTLWVTRHKSMIVSYWFHWKELSISFLVVSVSLKLVNSPQSYGLSNNTTLRWREGRKLRSKSGLITGLVRGYHNSTFILQVDLEGFKYSVACVN